MTNRIEVSLVNKQSFCIEIKDNFLYLYSLDEDGKKSKESFCKILSGSNNKLIIEAK